MYEKVVTKSNICPKSSKYFLRYSSENIYNTDQMRCIVLYILIHTPAKNTSFIPFIDFLGKVKKNSMGKVLCMPLDEVLESEVALFLVLMISERHFQSVVQCFHSLYTLSITPSITCLRKTEKDSEALMNGTSVVMQIEKNRQFNMLLVISESLFNSFSSCIQMFNFESKGHQKK